MAHLHLLTSLFRLPLLLWATLLPAGFQASWSQAPPPQEQINAALRSVLRLIDSGDVFLAYDREAGELRLLQDRALLRVCPVAVEDDIGEVGSVEDRLSLRVRHFRRSHAYARLPSSPFDWEQYLVADADQSCALYFATGLLIHVSSERDPRPRSLRIAPADLRALYNALPGDAALVILPTGWDFLPPDQEP